MKLPDANAEVERANRFELAMRAQYGETGTLCFYECPFCTYKEWFGTKLEGPAVIEIHTLPQDRDCVLCEAVDQRTPETFQLVVLAVASIASECARAVKRVEDRLDELVKKLEVDQR